eukprot:scaffold1840_cov111-Skeletonema_marinoi.AAC.2
MIGAGTDDSNGKFCAMSFRGQALDFFVEIFAMLNWHGFDDGRLMIIWRVDGVRGGVVMRFSFGSTHSLYYTQPYNVLYIINNKYSLTTQLSAQSRPSKSEREKRTIPTIGEN